MTESIELRPTQNTARPWKQLGFALLVGFFLALIAGAIWYYSFENKHAQSVFPGVSVAGVDLSGATLGQAVVRLNEELDYPKTGRILFTEGENRWFFTPAQLGLSINTVSSADEAFQVGRGHGPLANLVEQIRASTAGKSLDPSMIYDQRQAYTILQGISQQVNRPVIEAGVRMEGAEVVAQDGQIGRAVDIEATLLALDKLLLTKEDGMVPLVVKETKPALMDAGETASLARKILSEALVLRMPVGIEEPGPWLIEPVDLAKLLIIAHNEDGTPGYQITLNKPAIENYLNSIAPSVLVQPENMRAIFNDETRQFEPLQAATIGRELDIEASLNEVLTKAAAGEHEIALVTRAVNPMVKEDTTPESLGITGLFFEETSYFYGSDPARVQNIVASSSSFHGVFVPPGAVFSMADYLTDISLDNGYAEALIIVGDQTIKGVGGGVCQVSTTLFRTAFFAGLPIVERHAHAYRVSYYEQLSNGWVDNSLAGLDATVYFPVVDFKFKNDTGSWMLMETYVNGYSLTWKLYGNPDGRTVEWTTTGLRDITQPPEPVYREDPTLAEGQIKQTDWAVQGATINVTRTVYKNGSVYFNDAVNTYYQPWPDMYLVGPNTPIPGDG